MAKKKLISLPTIKSFEVVSYPMFNKDWKYTIHSGLNLMIGINAIGKTTTTNILTYGLVGSHTGYHDILNPEYFMQRLNEEPSDLEGTPQILIELQIGEHSLSLARSLAEDKILKLVVDKKEIAYHDELTEQYVETIKLFTGLSDLDDLRFLIGYLLIREEEGNYLLWDESAQSRVMRLLLHYTGFSEEFKELEVKIQKADSAYKREKDFMGRLEKRKKELENDRNSQLSTNKEYIKKEDLLGIIDELKKERQIAISEKDNYFSNSEVLKDKLKVAQNTLSSLKASYDENSDELKALESKFYKGTFNDPKSEFIFSKITNRQICLICNNHVSEKKVTEVIKKVNKNHECPVCSSNLSNIDEEVKSLTNREIKRMEALEQVVKNAYPDISKLEKEFEGLYKQVEETNSKIIEVDKKITELNQSIAYNTNKLDQIIQSSETPITNFDFAIAELQKQIEAYRITTEPLLTKYNKVKKLMEKKNDELNKALENYNDRLVAIFSSLAKNYFGESCGLVLRSKRPKGFEIPLSYFIPILTNKERLFQTRVSKSQAIFMEYLFRLSLLKLYYENTDIKPFLFLETSEGSFDVSNTALMADTLTQIGKMGFPFVIITNLSKIDFILHLLPDVKERRKRTFNLLEYANESVFAGRNKGALTRALKELSLN